MKKMKNVKENSTEEKANIENVSIMSIVPYVNSGRLKKDMIKACALLFKINYGITSYMENPKLYDYLHDKEIFEEFSNPLAEECMNFKIILDKPKVEYK